jgi:uncharacterized membrane protein
MQAYLIDWLSLLARWLHFITGIAWIGSSFYFIWLDNHLEAPRDTGDAAKGVGGEVWSLHGGGFYHAQKYTLAPRVLPETLHWFKWEAYSTWLSGMFLLVLLYWYGAGVYLIDPAGAVSSAPAAIAMAAGFIIGGWVIYDQLCKSPLGRNETTLALVLFVLVGVLAWGLCQLFSGRGAYMHFGAILGTIMVGNVFFVIIPGQKQMLAEVQSGAAPDPGPGLRGKQRSVHNTYFTLPVLFVMVSNHYAMTYNHAFNWAILMAITLAGALIRIYFVARHKGDASPLPAVVAIVLLAVVAALIAPRASALSQQTGQAVAFAEVQAVVHERCSSCHSSAPTHPAFPAAPAGVMLDTGQQIIAAAARIHQQTVVTRVMPIGNLTGMTDAERATLDRWYQSLESGHD